MTHFAVQLAIASALVLHFLKFTEGAETGDGQAEHFANMMDFPKACFYTEKNFGSAAHCYQRGSGDSSLH